MRKYGEWEIARFCMSCDEYLEDDNYFEHSGICVFCGAKGRIILPDVNERVRRKIFTTGRRAAIEATKSKNGIISFLKYRVNMFRKSRETKERNYTWEYKETNDARN